MGTYTSTILITNPNSKIIQKVKTNLTAAEVREMTNIDQNTIRTWRNFWVKAAKTRGYSNVAIAKDFDISESTVRVILKK